MSHDDPEATSRRVAPVRTVVVHADGGAVPSWGVRSGAVPVALAAREPVAELERALHEVECVLVDAAMPDPLLVARLVHQADGDVQVVLVGSEERRRTLQRALLFAPGIGELWLASPGEVAGGIADRAAGVTRQRRRFHRMRERMERDRVVASPQRAERALISDAYLANLLQELPDPVFSVDPAGRILSCNPAAGELLEGDAAGLLGTALADALRTGDAAALAALLAEAMTRPVRAEIAFVRADGAGGHGELRLRRVAGAEPPLLAVVLHDLTERHRAQQQLEDQALELEHQSSMLQDQATELEQSNDELLHQRAALERALAARNRFYAAMSHELRTPINAVIGYTGLALDGIYGPLAEPLREALGRSQRAAQHLHELVNDVLDLAKIEAGRIDLATETVEVPALAEDILLSVRPAAAESGTTVLFECRSPRTGPIVTDPRRVRQILLNLLGNALKFGAGRPVILRCEDAPGGVALSVIDEGPGIAPADQARIFEEFVQLDTRTHRGTGLGLPISRRLAELLGGALTVSSVPGAGSTFTLSLPREAPAAADRSAEDALA